MTQLWTAFFLGLVGSLHCAGMCGALVLALPSSNQGTFRFVTGRLAYNGGRLLAYSALGIAFSLMGHTIGLAGWQRWASLVSGFAILLGVLASSRHGLQLPVTRFVHWLKSSFGSLLRRRSLLSLFSLGLLNGMLPCGLVYVAGAGSFALGDFWSGVSFMFAFGLGTLPMMLGLGLAGRKFQATLGRRFQKLIPASVLLVGVLLVLRGLSLGIPFLSPDLTSAPPGAAHSCH